MSREDAEQFLRDRNICIWCHQNHIGCVASKPDDYSAHDRYWRANCVTARRPWWSAEELVRIIQRSEARR